MTVPTPSPDGDRPAEQPTYYPYDYDDAFESSEATLSSLDEIRDIVAREREALAPVQQSLKDAGYYAYGTFDDQQRWTIAVDDEAGRVDARIGRDGIEISIWASSPGMFADIENEWRRRAVQRLARLQINAISRGQLEPHQLAMWDDVEGGLAVRVTYELPFTRAAQAGPFVREHFPAVDDLLSLVESQLDV